MYLHLLPYEETNFIEKPSLTLSQLYLINRRSFHQEKRLILGESSKRSPIITQYIIHGRYIDGNIWKTIDLLKDTRTTSNFISSYLIPLLEKKYLYKVITFM